MRNLVLIAETEENGAIRKASLELVTLARYLAEEAPVTAILLCSECVLEQARDEIRRFVDRVIWIAISEGQDPAWVASELLSESIRAEQPEFVLFPGTESGRDLAAGTAERGGFPLLSNCLDGRIGTENSVIWQGAPFGGQLKTSLELSVEETGLVQMRKGLFPLPEPLENSGSFEAAGPAAIRRPLIRLVRELPRKEEVDLEEADVVVAGGRGAGGPEGFVLLEKLARALGGVVGASRQAVDRGWIGHEHLIGQSGRTVRPKLYIACGIAGYVQHLTGMRNSGFIVAVNKDPRALIFDVADICVVGDMFEVLPALIEEIHRIKG